VTALRQTGGLLAPGSIPRIKIVVEEYPDGIVADAQGLTGVFVGEGDTFEEALADVKSVIKFRIETFGFYSQDPEKSSARS